MRTQLKKYFALSEKLDQIGAHNEKEISETNLKFFKALKKGSSAETLYREFRSAFSSNKETYHLAKECSAMPMKVIENVYFPIFKRLIDESEQFRLDSMYYSHDEDLFPSFENEFSQSSSPEKKEVSTSQKKSKTRRIKLASARTKKLPAVVAPPSRHVAKTEIAVPGEIKPLPFPVTVESLIYAFGKEAAHLSGISGASHPGALSKAELSKSAKAAFAQSHANTCLSLHLQTLQLFASPSILQLNQEYALYWAYLGVEQALTVQFIQKNPETLILPHRLSYYAADLGLPLDNPWFSHELDRYSVYFRYAYQSGLRKTGAPLLSSISTATCSSSSSSTGEKESRESTKDFNLLIKKALELQLQALNLGEKDKDKLAKLEALHKMLDSNLPPEGYVVEPYSSKAIHEFRSVLQTRAEGLRKAANEITSGISKSMAELSSERTLKAHQLDGMRDLLEHVQRLSVFLEAMPHFPQPRFALLHMQTLLMGVHQLVEDVGLVLEKDHNVLIELGPDLHKLSYHIEKHRLGRFLTADQKKMLDELNFGNRVQDPHRYCVNTPVDLRSKFFKWWDELYQLSTTAIEEGEDFRPIHIKGDHLVILTKTCEQLIDAALAIVMKALK